MINPEDHLSRRIVPLIGHRMSVVDEGSGPVLLLIHGNPTYSYTWRNVIPFLAQEHRCLAPDLMGMGYSDLILPSGVESYGLDVQLEYLEMLLEILEIEGPLVVIGHDLGATLAIELARRLPDTVRGLALVEGVFRVANDDTLDPDVLHLLTELQGEDGEYLVLNQNLLIEHYLPALTLRDLTEAEMDAYRAPYSKPGEARRAMHSMVRQLPLKSRPGPLAERVADHRRWCSKSRLPKLVVGGKPGFLTPPSVLGAAARWRSTEVAAIEGAHFLTEDSPARLTATILDWLGRIDHSSRPPVRR